MEDTKTQPGNQPVPVMETLKIRTMQDDLKKASGLPAPSAPPETKPTPQLIPPVQPAALGVSTSPNRGEPPAHLPGVIIPEPPKPVFSPVSLASKTAVPAPPLPSAPPTPKPTPAPKPIISEPAIKPVPQTLTPPIATSASSGLYIKLTIAAAVILLVAAGAYFFWPKEQPPLPPLEPPLSLIPADSTQIISIKNETELTNKLSEIISASQAQGTLNYIPIKVMEPTEEFLSLEKLLNTLTIILPEIIASQTDGKYSLFSYNQLQSTSSPETENRFVLVLSLSSPASSQGLIAWEPKMLQNLELLYSSLPDNLPPQIDFADSERKDILPHRFINFGSPSLSLDYAISGNKIIFATSKQSMDRVLDLIIGSNE